MASESAQAGRVAASGERVARGPGEWRVASGDSEWRVASDSDDSESCQW